MTNPLQIQMPQIGTTGVVKPPNIMEQIAPILEALTQRKVANAQIQNYQSLAAQRQQEAAQQARDLQDKADAANAFHNHLSGIAVTLKPEKPSKEGVPSHQGVDVTNGTLLPLSQYLKSLSPGAALDYQKLISDYNASVLQSHQATESTVRSQHEAALTDVAHAEAARAARTAVDEVNTQNILKGMDLTTDRGQLNAVRRVLQEVGPTAASAIARTLNTGTGFDKIVAPDGTLYVGHNGNWRRDINVGVKPDHLLVDATRRNAGLAVDLIDEQSKLIRDLGVGSSKNPTLAAVAEASRVLGVSTEGISNWLRNDPEQLTRMLRTRFGHLYVGLLPHSRSTGPLIQNLTESYWAPAGSGTPLLQRAERDRQKLRAILVGLRDGKTTDWSRLPGWSEAASAAAAEGQAAPQTGAPGTTVTTNPDDWLNGPPPEVPPQ